MAARLKTIGPRVQTLTTSRVAPVSPAGQSWGSGRGGRPWRRIRQRILLRDRYTCQQCGYVGMDLEVDHIVNVARGGSDDDSNLQALCKLCHKAKTARESRGE